MAISHELDEPDPAPDWIAWTAGLVLITLMLVSLAVDAPAAAATPRYVGNILMRVGMGSLGLSWILTDRARVVSSRIALVLVCIALAVRIVGWIA